MLWFYAVWTEEGCEQLFQVKSKKDSNDGAITLVRLAKSASGLDPWLIQITLIDQNKIKS